MVGLRVWPDVPRHAGRKLAHDSQVSQPAQLLRVTLLVGCNHPPLSEGRHVLVGLKRKAAKVSGPDPRSLKSRAGRMSAVLHKDERVGLCDLPKSFEIRWVAAIVNDVERLGALRDQTLDSAWIYVQRGAIDVRETHTHALGHEGADRCPEGLGRSDDFIVAAQTQYVCAEIQTGRAGTHCDGVLRAAILREFSLEFGHFVAPAEIL